MSVRRHIGARFVERSTYDQLRLMFPFDGDHADVPAGVRRTLAKHKKPAVIGPRVRKLIVGARRQPFVASRQVGRTEVQVARPAASTGPEGHASAIRAPQRYAVRKRIVCHTNERPVIQLVNPGVHVPRIMVVEAYPLAIGGDLRPPPGARRHIHRFLVPRSVHPDESSLLVRQRRPGPVRQRPIGPNRDDRTPEPADIHPFDDRSWRSCQLQSVDVEWRDP